RAAYWAGASGVHPRVGARLFAAHQPVFTGAVAWRGLVAMQALPSHLANMQGVNWLGPHGHVLHYPVRRGAIMKFIKVVERDDWQVESWVTQGTKDELANDFRGWHADVDEMISRIETRYQGAMMVRGDRYALKGGSDGARPEAALEPRPLHPARRRLPSDPAVPRPGRRDGDR